MQLIYLLSFYLSVCCIVLPVFAQLPPQPLEQGAGGLALLLRKLNRFETVLYITAHPDDEDNGLLVQLNRIEGVRTALLTLTRGAGGQNQIGDEQGIALSVLRTEELASMHRLDGAEQYFARAVDFGYSFSIDETLEKWGRREILNDIVYLIRSLRPDVILCMTPRGEGGGQHHQASGLLALEAFHAAGDPAVFPEQIAAGLHPWQAKKAFSRMFRARFIPDQYKEKAIEIPVGIFDPLLGKTALQLGQEARSFHICQAMNGPEPLPRRAYARYLLETSTVPLPKAGENLFSGIASSPYNLLTHEEQQKHPGFKKRLTAYSQWVKRARQSFSIAEPWKTIDPLHEAFSQLHTMIEWSRNSDLSESSKQNVWVRLKYQEHVIEQALALAHGVRFNALADRGEVTPGADLKVSLHTYHAGPVPLEKIDITLDLPPAWKVDINQQTAHPLDPFHEIETVFDLNAPQTAAQHSVYWDYHPTASRYVWNTDVSFGSPFAPSPLRAKCNFTYSGNVITIEKPITYRYENPWGVGGQEKEVTLLPPVSLTLSPDVLLFTRQERRKAVTVEVRNHQEAPLVTTVSLNVPHGWRCEPESISVSFSKEESIVPVVFTVTPEPAASGVFTLQPAAEANGKVYTNRVQTIAYQHIRKRFWITPATAKALVTSIETVPADVGYVMGSGDHVPQALEQLGCQVTRLDETAVAEEDLSRYDLIVLGVRAYLNRMDLRKHNTRLLEYVHQGGTVVVQYNRYEFNDAQWAPYPARVSGNRVTDENAPLELLLKHHPLFHTPNPVTAADWQGWVQERGTYFLDSRDERYVDLLAAEDPFPNNAGQQKGILVETEFGKGKWIYCGLALFRQLPAGVPGAYTLLANLVGYAKQ